MNTSQKVVEVGAVHGRGVERWLFESVLVLIGAALACWTWWLFV